NSWLTIFNSWITHCTFLSFICFPVKVHFFIWTGCNTVSPCTTSILVNEYNAIFIPFIHRTRWTRGYTRCINTMFADPRSEEHTSELQSRFELVCRLLLEKKNGASTVNA